VYLRVKLALSNLFAGEMERDPTSRMVILRKAIPAILIVGILSAASIRQQTVKAHQRQDVLWELLCIQYGGLINIHTPCSELAHGPSLTERGKPSIVRLFGGGMMYLLGADPSIVAMISKAVRGVCP
jgi:hypothetical protein